MKKFRLLSFVLMVVVMIIPLYAQSNDNSSAKGPEFFNPIITGGNLFTITPDARSAGMGEIGLTTSADAYSQFHNISKLPFIDKTWGVSISYTPWMSEITKDINLSYLTGYYTWGADNGLKHAVSASFRYFNIGEGVAFFNHLYEPIAIKPYELSFDLGYALRFYEHWSVGLGMKYLRSDYNFSSQGLKGVVNAILFDLSSTYQTKFAWGTDRIATLRAALALNNLGGKMSYDGGKSYLYSPAIFRLGVGVSSEVEPLHKVGVHFEMSKMMAPTYPMRGEDDYEEHLKKYKEQSALSGIFNSWSDAPGGFSEELKEMIFSIGAEYIYDDRFFARAGYRHQDKSKGTGAGFTLGAGLEYKMLTFDFSYFLASQAKSPLNNTLRFTLGIDF
ncbi:type IX secretion system outer membrane channel protein PorV [Porphyromonadaceae bacterium W3.11]|nr:type IX secretion system outer membrane channel protein PorV [Porphyromonadaceae bacterium W3.11]